MIVNENGTINPAEVYTSKKGNRFKIIGSKSNGTSIWNTLDTIRLLDTTVTVVENGYKTQTHFVTLTRKKLKNI